MSEDLTLITGTKSEQYQSLLPQIKAVLEGESDFNANLANICACLKQQFNWLWVGFYVVKENELVVGPYQGPLACTRISKGRGVCGRSWEKKQTIIVPDVNAFPGHIACSSLSRSEIVVPLIRNNEVIAVLDADSELLEHFDETDQKYLEELLSAIDI
jgi:GAF domain-containing protein